MGKRNDTSILFRDCGFSFVEIRKHNRVPVGNRFSNSGVDVVELSITKAIIPCKKKVT